MQKRQKTEIPFHVPFVSGEEEGYLKEVIKRGEFSGDGYFTRLSEQWLEHFTRAEKVLLTSSCTHALEMCAMLCNIQPGDEVIMPSFNFVSAANAFVLREAKVVFIDIRPDTMNIDEQLIEAAINGQTKAIVVVHYGGVACEMEAIMKVAARYGLKVIEDAAHGIGAWYKERHLGTIGHLGVLSFHASKNIHCGEGGALLINDPEMVQTAEVIREKGTNRKAFISGAVEKYSWVSLGSSYLASELNAAFLYGQLPHIEKVNAFRLSVKAEYERRLQNMGHLGYSSCPPFCFSNGHIFYIKCESEQVRDSLRQSLENKGIEAFFHYIPLHSSLAGKNFGRFSGVEKYTTVESSKLLRLPSYFGFAGSETVCAAIEEFFDE
ncbi:MAG: dTDP-4-amino-4,6-dideoxygalactose transaminase [Phaeodactylibacter sp.]|nr:dTDP-4-amino-4,6-dideoxygalactose transaminase [Phaeodactylibacter sp.]